MGFFLAVIEFKQELREKTAIILSLFVNSWIVIVFNKAAAFDYFCNHSDN